MNWKRAAITTGFVLPVIGILAFGMTRDPTQIDSPLPGKPAPTFSLSVFAPGEGQSALAIGDTVNLADHRGGLVVLNFWASWCLACRDEHAELSSTAKAFYDRGVRFYGLLYNDRAPAGVRWIEEMGGQSYPSLLDPGARTAIDYGLYGVPETFIVTGDGRVIYKHTGPITERFLSQKLDSLLRVGSP